MSRSPFPSETRADTRARAIEAWVKKHLGSVAHEHRVLTIADKLLDLTAGFHTFGTSERHLLNLAILVHDVGRSIDDDEHPAHGAALLLNDASLPLFPAERRTLAYLTRFHRGAVPDLKCDDILHPADNHPSARGILAFLRAADALDSRWLGSPKLLMSLHRRTVHIRCHVAKDTPKVRRMFLRKKKFKLLEETLRCQVSLDLALTDALTLVA